MAFNLEGMGFLLSIVLDTLQRDTDYLLSKTLSVGRQLQKFPSDKYF